MLEAMSTTSMATLHLLVGPAGAGKSTFARRRVAQSAALFLDLDACMVRLYGDDARPAEGVLEWYLERRERCRALLWDLALEALTCGADVYLELGLLTRAEREETYQRCRAEDLSLRVYLLDAPRELRRQRVLARNDSGAPHVQIVPLPFFERASDAWQAISEDERATWDIQDV